MSPVSLEHPRPSASLSTFLAVALLSAAVLGFEIALSRVFATVLRYQFAFLVVSLALCGLGLGGLWAHLRPRTSLENAALGWGVSVFVALGAILRGVFAFVPQHYWLAALLVLVPFGFAGTFLSLAFGRFKEQGGRLYAFDLAGAALAAALSVALMQVVSAVDACLLFGVLGALAGALVARSRGFALGISAILLVAVGINTRAALWSVQPIPPDYHLSNSEWEAALRTGQLPEGTLADQGVTQSLFTEIGAGREAARRLGELQRQGKAPKNLVWPVTQIKDTRWNAFARTDVAIDAADVLRLQRDPLARPDSYYVYTNGNVPTNMLHWSGREDELPRLVGAYPISDWTFGNAAIKGADVFSIGPGGGLDALLALRYGARRFDGAEINPSIVGLMNEPEYARWNGGIYRHPKVHVRVAEGRDAVRESKGRYRLVFSALTKTATAGQGGALLESFIYTREAFDDYMNALDAQGSMAIVGDQFPLMVRFTATAIDFFKRHGDNEFVAGQHITLIADPQKRGPYGFVLLVTKSPISPQRALEMKLGAIARGLEPYWIPGQAANDADLSPVLSGTFSLDGLLKEGRAMQPLPLDLSPCSDDRPFVLDLSTSPTSLFESSPSLTWMLALGVLATLALAAALSFGERGTRGNWSASALGTLLFFLLGAGFMLVEVPLISKLTLPLGYPTLSLSVILFSILLGGGAGALWSQRFEGARLRRHALVCALGVAALAGTFALGNDAVSRALLSLPLAARCLTLAVLLLPLGFVLGTPFPSGLRLLARGERGVALAWALNGTASVVGSIGAAIGAKMLGYSLVLVAGALVYLLVAGVFALSRSFSAEPSPSGA